jgi:hypothetical protein
MAQLELHPDRLFPAEQTTRAITRRLYTEVKNLPGSEVRVDTALARKSL